VPSIELFGETFLANVQTLVQRHHTIYPRLPPQGMFFEAIVEQAFRLSGWEMSEIVPTTPNSPWHDLLIGGMRLSIKTETGKATRKTKINITKLCTTEAGEWPPEALVGHAVAHIDRHDRMLMLRSIWKPGAFDYQLVEIPLDLLKLMRNAQFSSVGVRKGRRSVGGNITHDGERVFHVHFDGADGKCQIHRLLTRYCTMLREWNQPIA
jgi:hypothetical protein